MCAAALPSNAGSNTDLVRQLNRAFVDVARTVSPSVVVITATQRPVFMDTDVGSEPRESDPLDFWRRFNRQFDEEPFQGQGSGVIIRKDGYILTKKIKSDPRFAGVQVIMHSSLSGMSNQQLGKSVGVDEYVPKFEAQKLSETLTRRLLGSVPVVRPNA